MERNIFNSLKFYYYPIIILLILNSSIKFCTQQGKLSQRHKVCHDENVHKAEMQRRNYSDVT